MENSIIQIDEPSYALGMTVAAQIAKASKEGYDAGAKDGVNFGFTMGALTTTAALVIITGVGAVYADNKDAINSKIKSVFRKKNK